jgi:hypothetical protein
MNSIRARLSGKQSFGAGAMPAPAASWDGMPEDNWHQIFSFLQPVEIIRMGGVCKAVQGLAGDVCYLLLVCVTPVS